MKLLKTTILPILILISVIITILQFFKPKETKTGNSPSNRVNDLINIIDNSINKIGTFDADHLPLFKALTLAKKEDIIKLHHDFGTRNYNFITGKYKLINLWGWSALTTRKDLNTIFDNEFSSSQLSDIIFIYESKGLSFPLISK